MKNDLEKLFPSLFSCINVITLSMGIPIIIIEPAMSEITTNRPPIMITQKEPRSLPPLPPLLPLPEPINPEIIRLQERESRLKQQLEIKKRLLGKYHPDVAKILNALVIVSIKQEKEKQAELFGDQVLELTQKLPP